MESHQFWAFFVIALIAGGAITLAVSNTTMTGYAVQAAPPRTLLQRIFGIRAAETCTDTDNLDYYFKGSCTECVGNVCAVPKYDTCYGNVLKEWYCEGTKCKSVDYACPLSCQDGACEEVEISCDDSDGDDIYTQGTCTDQYGTNTDYCVSNNQVIEYTCPMANDVCAVSMPINCPVGYKCIDGACIPVTTCLWAVGSSGVGNYIYPINDPNFKIMDEDPLASPDVWMGDVAVDSLGIEEFLDVEEGIIYEGEPENVHGLATYEGVLDMLNKCDEIATPGTSPPGAPTIWLLSCNTVCSKRGQTCIKASFFHVESESRLVPDPLVAMSQNCATSPMVVGGRDVLQLCTCCSP